MPSYRSSKPLPPSGLPLSVENYLRSGAAEGGRNHAVFGAAAQLRDAGMSQGDAVSTLLPRATADGLSASEATGTIESAFRGQKREAPVGKSGPWTGGTAPGALPERPSKGIYRIKRRERDDRRDDSGGQPGSAWARATNMPLPERVEDGFEELLRAAFEEGEGVCIGGTFMNEEGEHKPDAGVTLSREQWIDRVRQKGGDFAKVHTSKNGHFIRINPMRIAADSKHGDADVSKFRHVLVEFDVDSTGATIKKERQFGAILASGLPVTAILDSGNKSIHAWVRVDAANAEEYKERAAEVYELFGEDIDDGNHNPSRYSRCPDGIRTVGGEQVRQALLKVGVGAKSWTDWKITKEIENSGEEWTYDDLINYDVVNDPSAMIGERRWLCRGSNLIIVAPSGVGKSSIQAQFKLGWATGRSDLTFGVKAVRPLRQLTIQAENDQGDVAEVILAVKQAQKFTHEEEAFIRENCIWRRISNKSGDAFLSLLEAFVQKFRPDICWIDPLVAYIGGDISDAEAVAHFCYEGLSTISIKTGVIFAIIHHTGKPKDSKYKAEMTATDMAYSGLGSSNLTNWPREVLVLSRIKTADENAPPTFSLTATKRRTRAGFRTMPANGDPMDVVPASEIYVRHSTGGGIGWEQCPEPDRPKRGRPKGEKAEKDAGGPKGKPGAPCSLSAAQKREIIETAAAHGGKLSTLERNQLGQKFSKSMATISRYLKRIEERAALMAGTVQDALEADIAEDTPPAAKPERLPYKD